MSEKTSIPPATWEWFDKSPMGETYGVRVDDEVLCYTNRYKQGYEDAVEIAEAWNRLHSDGLGVTMSRVARSDANTVGIERSLGRQRLEHHERV